MSVIRSPYTYRAFVRRVIDADTFVADVDLGFQHWLHDQSFRLLGLNAREKNEPGGAEALSNLTRLLDPATPVLLSSVKPDKFGGRYDAVVTLTDGTDLSDHLIRTQWAAAWNGKGVKPSPPWPRTLSS